MGKISVNDKILNNIINANCLGHGRLQAWARRGTPLCKCCKVFLCISSYIKTLSRRIIYALFSQPVVGFWGLLPQSPTWARSTALKNLCPWTPNLPTGGKKSFGCKLLGAYSLAC